MANSGGDIDAYEFADALGENGSKVAGAAIRTAICPGSGISSLKTVDYYPKI